MKKDKPGNQPKPEPEVPVFTIPDETAIAEKRLRDGEEKLRKIQAEMRGPRTEITSRVQGTGASVNEIARNIFTEMDATLRRLGITEDDLKAAREASEKAELQARFDQFHPGRK
jgi:hypothetical protein